MNETAMRHMVAFLATVVCFFAFYGGYISGKSGWWWTGFGLLIVYGGVYRLISK